MKKVFLSGVVAMFFFLFTPLSTHAADWHPCYFGLLRCDENGIVWQSDLVLGNSQPAQLSTGSDGLTSLISGVGSFINSYIIPLILAIAFIFFIWNLARFFIIEAANSDKREEAKRAAIYGIAAFVVIASIWGLVNVLVSSLNIDRSNPVCPDYFSLFGLTCPGSSDYTYSTSSGSGDTSGSGGSTSSGGNATDGSSSGNTDTTSSKLAPLIYGNLTDVSAFNFYDGDPRALNKTVSVGANKSCTDGLTTLANAAKLEAVQASFVLYKKNGQTHFANLSDRTSKKSIDIDYDTWHALDLSANNKPVIIHTHQAKTYRSTGLSLSGSAPSVADMRLLCDSVVPNNATLMIVDGGTVWTMKKTAATCPRSDTNNNALLMVETLFWFSQLSSIERQSEYELLLDDTQIPYQLERRLKAYDETGLASLTQTQVYTLGKALAAEGGTTINKTSIDNFCEGYDNAPLVTTTDSKDSWWPAFILALQVDENEVVAVHKLTGRSQVAQASLTELFSDYSSGNTSGNSSSGGNTSGNSSSGSSGNSSSGSSGNSSSGGNTSGNSSSGGNTSGNSSSGSSGNSSSGGNTSGNSSSGSSGNSSSGGNTSGNSSSGGSSWWKSLSDIITKTLVYVFNKTNTNTVSDTSSTSDNTKVVSPPAYTPTTVTQSEYYHDEVQPWVDYVAQLHNDVLNKQTEVAGLVALGQSGEFLWSYVGTFSQTRVVAATYENFEAQIPAQYVRSGAVARIIQFHTHGIDSYNTTGGAGWYTPEIADKIRSGQLPGIYKPPSSGDIDMDTSIPTTEPGRILYRLIDRPGLDYNKSSTYIENQEINADYEQIVFDDYGGWYFRPFAQGEQLLEDPNYTDLAESRNELFGQQDDPLRYWSNVNYDSQVGQWLSSLSNEQIKKLAQRTSGVTYDNQPSTSEHRSNQEIAIWNYLLTTTKNYSIDPVALPTAADLLRSDATLSDTYNKYYSKLNEVATSMYNFNHNVNINLISGRHAEGNSGFGHIPTQSDINAVIQDYANLGVFVRFAPYEQLENEYPGAGPQYSHSLFD